MRKPSTTEAIRGLLAALSWITLAGVALAPLAAAPARAAGDTPPAGHDAGTWDLNFEKGNRRCRLFLRLEPHGDAYALSMPAGCRKAFPMLMGATSWSPAVGEHVLLKTDAGATLFDFAPHGAASLAATVGEADLYELTPINPTLQNTLRTAALQGQAVAPTATGAGGVLIEAAPAKGKGTAQKALATAPVLPPTTVEEVAGHYAVVRQDRDTGCMVTLETAGTTKSELKARLAPACRDQGIVIFDPVGWQLTHGSQLVLTAKKGHTTSLIRRDDKTWANAPPRGSALVLKRL